jgi:hypothetical protein
MKVALVTTWEEPCGLFMYSKNLLQYGTDKYRIINYASSYEQAYEISLSCDVIHVNLYAPILSLDITRLLSETQKPTLVTNHRVDTPEIWFALARAVVVHRMPQSQYHPNIHVMPHGIPEKNLPDDDPKSLVLCHAGFPFPWKNHVKICQAANRLHEMWESPRVLLFMPYARTDPSPIIEECRRISKVPLDIVTDWLDEDNLIPRMHSASVMVWYTGESNVNSSEGPSGSVGMAIASKRPVVVNGNSSQYAGILNYSGIYPVYLEEHLAETILRAHRNGGYAEELLKEHSWYRVAREYSELYKSII